MVNLISFDSFDRHQKKVIEEILMGTSRIINVSAGAGTGKSTILRYLNSLSLQTPLLSCASSNSAAANIGAGTIHKLLGFVLEDYGDEQDIEQVSTDLVNGAIVAVDEYSMLSTKLLDALLATDAHKIILFGDPMQLPPVKSARIDLTNYKVKHLTLHTNYRVDNIELAERVDAHRGMSEITAEMVDRSLVLEMLKSSPLESVFLANNNSEVIGISEELKSSKIKKAYFTEPITLYTYSDEKRLLSLTIAHKRTVVNVNNYKPKSKHKYGEHGKYKETYGIPARDGLKVKPLSLLDIQRAVRDGDIDVHFKKFGKPLLKLIINGYAANDPSSDEPKRSLLYKQLIATAAAGGNMLSVTNKEDMYIAYEIINCCLAFVLPSDVPIWVHVSVNLYTEDTLNDTKTSIKRYADSRADDKDKLILNDAIKLIKHTDILVDHTDGTVEIGTLGFKARVFKEGTNEFVKGQLTARLNLMNLVYSQLLKDLSHYVSSNKKMNPGKRVNLLLTAFGNSREMEGVNYTDRCDKEQRERNARITSDRLSMVNKLINMKASLENLPHMRSSQAMTVYMSQGLGFPIVFVGKTTKKTLYTAVSRAKINFIGVK